jgi:hypothetical protein
MVTDTPVKLNGGKTCHGQFTFEHQLIFKVLDAQYFIAMPFNFIGSFLRASYIANVLKFKILNNERFGWGMVINKAMLEW